MRSVALTFYVLLVYQVSYYVNEKSECFQTVLILCLCCKLLCAFYHHWYHTSWVEPRPSHPGPVPRLTWFLQQDSRLSIHRHGRYIRPFSICALLRRSHTI